jgi:hypothetical protein
MPDSQFIRSIPWKRAPAFGLGPVTVMLCWAFWESVQQPVRFVELNHPTAVPTIAAMTLGVGYLFAAFLLNNTVFVLTREQAILRQHPLPLARQKSLPTRDILGFRRAVGRRTNWNEQTSSFEHQVVYMLEAEVSSGGFVNLGTIPTRAEADRLVTLANGQLAIWRSEQLQRP